MIVRHMRPDEIDLNINLARQYAEEAAETVPEIGEQYDRNSVVSTVRLRTINPHYCWLSLLDNTRPVGFVSGTITQAPWNDEVIWGHIELIYVLESHRNIDAFRKLTDAFEDWAIELGAQKITAGDIGMNPERSKALYKSIGFTEGCFLTREIV